MYLVNIEKILQFTNSSYKKIYPKKLYGNMNGLFKGSSFSSKDRPTCATNDCTCKPKLCLNRLFFH